MEDFDDKHPIANLIRSEVDRSRREAGLELRHLPTSLVDSDSGIRLVQTLIAMSPVFLLVFSAIYIFMLAIQEPDSNQKKRAGNTSTQQVWTSDQLGQATTLEARVTELIEKGVLPIVAMIVVTTIVILVYSRMVNQRL